MRTVGIRQLKNKLSEYVRAATGGEIILVTDRDRVVAEISAPRPGRPETVDDAALLALIRTGLYHPPTIRLVGPPPRLPVAPLAEIMAGLESDREDR